MMFFIIYYSLCATDPLCNLKSFLYVLQQVQVYVDKTLHTLQPRLLIPHS